MFFVCTKSLGPETGHDRTVILVAMHHTFDEDYTLPNHREQGNHKNVFLVDCLFFETKGLLTCRCNKKAVKMVREKVITQQVNILFIWCSIILVYGK